MEFAVGRASQRSAALSFNILEPKAQNGTGLSMQQSLETIC